MGTCTWACAQRKIHPSGTVALAGSLCFGNEGGSLPLGLGSFAGDKAPPLEPGPHPPLQSPQAVVLPRPGHEEVHRDPGSWDGRQQLWPLHEPLEPLGEAQHRPVFSMSRHGRVSCLGRHLGPGWGPAAALRAHPFHWTCCLTLAHRVWLSDVGTSVWVVCLERPPGLLPAFLHHSWAWGVTAHPECPELGAPCSPGTGLVLPV